MNDELCECENLGWDGIKCPLHPMCNEDPQGCLKYSDPYLPAHSEKQQWREGYDGPRD